MSFELIIVCDCMFPSTVLSGIEKRGRGGRTLPTVASTHAFVHYSENKFLFQTIYMKCLYSPQTGAAAWGRLKAVSESVTSGAEKAQPLNTHPSLNCSNSIVLVF